MGRRALRAASRCDHFALYFTRYPRPRSRAVRQRGDRTPNEPARRSSLEIVDGCLFTNAAIVACGNPVKYARSITNRGSAVNLTPGMRRNLSLTIEMQQPIEFAGRRV